MGITVTEGNTWGAKFIEAFKGGFPENNHATTMAGLFADKTAWDWSDGFKGEGSPDEIFTQFQKTWGFMVAEMKWTPNMFVDTTNSKIIFYGNLVINITGGLPESNLVENPICFILTLDQGKCVKWEALWDNEEPTLLKALSSVSEKLKASQATAA